MSVLWQSLASILTSGKAKEPEEKRKKKKKKKSSPDQDHWDGDGSKPAFTVHR